MPSLPARARRRLQPGDFTCTRGSHLQTPPLQQVWQRAGCSEPHDTAPTTSAGARPPHGWGCAAPVDATGVVPRVRKGAAARRRAQRRRQDGTVTVPVSDNACGCACWKGCRCQCASRQAPLMPPADCCRPVHHTACLCQRVVLGGCPALQLALRDAAADAAAATAAATCSAVKQSWHACAVSALRTDFLLQQHICAASVPLDAASVSVPSASCGRLDAMAAMAVAVWCLLRAAARWSVGVGPRRPPQLSADRAARHRRHLRGGCAVFQALWRPCKYDNQIVRRRIV